MSLYLFLLEEKKKTMGKLESFRVETKSRSGNMDAYLLEVQVHNRNEVQGVRIVVVIWITIPVIHPQLDQPAFTWHHVNCITAWVTYLLLHQMMSQLDRHMYCLLHHNGSVNAGHPLDVLCS